MLEKLTDPAYQILSRPDKSVLRYLDAIMASSPMHPVFYEIGIGIGATTLPVAEKMNNSGEILLFSREKDVRAVASDLFDRGYSNVNPNWGSPDNTYSGYHFELAIGAAEKELPMFDLAYIDGGHVFHLDAPTACVLKELCKPGGYMIFDDYDWYLGKSPTWSPAKRPATAIEYDQRQIETRHVKLVCQLFMDTDTRFEFVGMDSDTVTYRRLPDATR